jgi:putative membrane protein
MQQASRRFSDEQRAQINQAVAEAESKTSAEILPVVATASGRYDRPEDIVGLWLAMIGLIVTWALLPTSHAESGSWGGTPGWAKLLVMVVVAVAGFVLGAVIASRVHWLRRLFTPRQQMRDEVAARARAVFFDGRVHHTSGATGLLVYVSLYEHMAAVLADQNILDKLGQNAVDELCGVLTASLHEAHPAEAICRTVTATGERLAPVLPRADDDVDELPNALVTLDD